MTETRPPGRRRLRRWVVVGALLAVLLVAGQQVLLLSGAPTHAKDCAIHAQPTPTPPPRTAPAAEFSGELAQRRGHVNDASCLNRTPVYGVVRPRSFADVRRALAFARSEKLTVSVAGARHSMGGQAMYPEALVLDMRDLDRVEVDTTDRSVRVQAGAAWHQVLQAVHPRGLSVASMPSIDVLSVGGTVSVNAHGLDFRSGSLASTVRSLRVMLADGSVHEVDRAREPELFRAVIGGYGLFGVILDVRLDLVDSEMYRLRTRTIDYRAFPEVFATRIDGDARTRLMYTHLSTSPTSFLRQAVVYGFETVDADEPVPPLRERSHDVLGRLVLNLARKGELGQKLKWRAQRDLLPHVRGCRTARNEALREAEACLVARNQAMYETLGLLQNRLDDYTDVLQEYFLPHDRLVPFLDEARRILQSHDAVTLNASIRAVHHEDVLLDYARGDRFSLVLYLSQKVDRAGTEDMAALTRRLVDAALEQGGTFYLPYQQHYSRDQLLRAYPRVDAFFAAKRRYDPQLLFMNSLYDRYAAPS